VCVWRVCAVCLCVKTGVCVCVCVCVCVETGGVLTDKRVYVGKERCML